MSLYASYLEERTTDHIIESDLGFVTYRYLDGGKSVYIVDLYVPIRFRKQGFASKLADLVCKEAKGKGYAELLGTVVPEAKGSTDSLKVLLAYGMTLQSVAQNAIVFRKDI